VADQRYLPDALAEARFYDPGRMGFEKTIRERLEWWTRGSRTSTSRSWRGSLDTAGGKVVGTVVQRIDQPNPRFYIGKGKAKQLEGLVDRRGRPRHLRRRAEPDQGKNLEDFLGSGSWIAPSSSSTSSRPAPARRRRMQVELAQLEYLLPRLKRMWSHLSRIRGGIGLRGPGETQLETDRRLIGTRIGELKRELKGVTSLPRDSGREGRERSGRRWSATRTPASPRCCGRSPARPVRGGPPVRDPRSATRVVDLGSGHEALVTDTVGFIRKLPTTSSRRSVRRSRRRARRTCSST
jgi:GTPase